MFQKNSTWSLAVIFIEPTKFLNSRSTTQSFASLFAIKLSTYIWNKGFECEKVIKMIEWWKGNNKCVIDDEIYVAWSFCSLYSLYHLFTRWRYQTRESAYKATANDEDDKSHLLSYFERSLAPKEQISDLILLSRTLSYKLFTARAIISEVILYFRNNLDITVPI